MINKVWLDEKNQVLRQKLIGDALLTEAPEYFAQVSKLMARLPRRLAIVDLSEADARRILNRKAREYIARYSTPVRYERVAYINTAPSLRILAKIIKEVSTSKFYDQGEIEFFKSEDQALAWLKVIPEQK